MPHRRLIHIKLAHPIERVLNVYLHWLESDNDWLEQGYEQITCELCQIVASNIEELESRARSDAGKRVYQKVEDSNMLSIAVAVESRDSASQCILGVKETHNHQYENCHYSLLVWLGPKTKSVQSSVEWSVDCVC